MNPAISRSSRIWSVLLRGVQPKISPRGLRCKSCQRTSNIKSFSTSSGGKANTIDVNSSIIPNTSNTIGQVKSADALGGVEPIGGKSSEDPEIDKAKLDKLANLGTLLREIKAATPHLLQTPFPRAILAADITLRLFPTTHPGIPTIRGGVLGYLAAARMLQMVVAGMIVDTRNARIRVLSERLIKDEANSGTDSNGKSTIGVPSRYILKWCTCEASESSGGASNGNSSAPPEDPVSYVNRIQHIVVPRGTPPSAYYPTLFQSAAVVPEASAATTVQSNSHRSNNGYNDGYYNDSGDDNTLTKNLQKLEFLDSTTTEGNVLFGIFEFEFTENCDKIRVHTIQNVEILNEGVFGQEGGAVPSSC